MGCNCASTGTLSDYQVTLATGETKTFTTEADARMAVARQGGTWRAIPRK